MKLATNLEDLSEVRSAAYFMRRCIPTRRKAPPHPPPRALLTLTSDASRLHGKIAAWRPRCRSRPNPPPWPKPLRPATSDCRRDSRHPCLDQDATLANLRSTGTRSSFRTAGAGVCEYFPHDGDVESLRFTAALAVSPQIPDSPLCLRRLSGAESVTPWASPGFDKLDNLHDNWWCSLTPHD